jgi:hypothetical protein
MGFMDNMLEKSERRLLLAVIEGFESIENRLDYGLEQITCSENPRFKHLAVRFSPPTDPTDATFLHRCRNDWYCSSRTDGHEYLHLPGVEKLNRNLAIAQLAMVIKAVMDGD